MDRFIKYLKATAAEMKHVSWPTQNQTIIYSALVIAICGIVAVLLGLFDYVFTGLLNRIV
jgi:preprotein translocase SecE subunit